MFVKKTSKGKVYGADLTSNEKKALEMEIRRMYVDYDDNHIGEICAMVMWVLHQEFGWGPKRMKRFYRAVAPEVAALHQRYEQMEEGDSLWLCTKKLKDYGVDIFELMKEDK